MTRRLTAGLLGIGVITCVTGGARGQAVPLTAATQEPAQYQESVALRWNAALLDAVRAARFAPMLTARALAIVHTCTYDAWAAHEARALGTMFGDALRRPPQEHTLAAKEVALSYAAFRALVNLFPSQRTVFERVMEEMGLDPTYESTDPSTPAGVGNAACGTVLTWRAHDGANQFGDLSGGSPYSDYTGYVPELAHAAGRSGPLAAPHHLGGDAPGVSSATLASRHPVRAYGRGPVSSRSAARLPEYALPPAGRSRPAPQRRPRRSEKSRRRILGGRPRDRNSPRATGASWRSSSHAVTTTTSMLT